MIEHRDIFKLAGILSGIAFFVITKYLIPIPNLIGLVGVAFLAWYFRKENLSTWARFSLLLLLVPITFWVATFRPDGFSYPLVFSLPGASGTEPRFQLHLNLSKAIAGYILLYCLWPRVKPKPLISQSVGVLMVLLSSALIILLAIFCFNLKLQPKTFEQIVAFAAVNLLITCVAEEVFLRFLLQQQIQFALQKYVKNRLVVEAVPLLITTIIFVLIHNNLGSAIWLYATAGFLYGLSYTLNKSIFFPIGLHFLVNFIHFGWLSYPV